MNQWFSRWPSKLVDWRDCWRSWIQNTIWTTINKEYYLSLLRRLHEAIHQKVQIYGRTILRNCTRMIRPSLLVWYLIYKNSAVVWYLIYKNNTGTTLFTRCDFMALFSLPKDENKLTPFYNHWRQKQNNWRSWT